MGWAGYIYPKPVAGGTNNLKYTGKTVRRNPPEHSGGLLVTFTSFFRKNYLLAQSGAALRIVCCSPHFPAGSPLAPRRPDYLSGRGALSHTVFNGKYAALDHWFHDVF
jgi:hypothetical protein